ncbi:MAG: DUF305 domain-containing protein [Candidatus Baltobacteraceae bacterium]
MNTSLNRVALAAVLALGVVAVTSPQTKQQVAQTSPAATMMPMPGMGGMSGAGACKPMNGMMGMAKTPAERAMVDAMRTGMSGSKMKPGAGMMAWSGNPDVDYLTMALHRANVELAMAKVELTYGKDPAVRAIAKSTIAAANGRIARLRAVLATLHR